MGPKTFSTMILGMCSKPNTCPLAVPSSAATCPECHRLRMVSGSFSPRPGPGHQVGALPSAFSPVCAHGALWSRNHRPSVLPLLLALPCLPDLILSHLPHFILLFGKSSDDPRPPISNPTLKKQTNPPYLLVNYIITVLPTPCCYPQAATCPELPLWQQRGEGNKGRGSESRCGEHLKRQCEGEPGASQA